MQLIHTLSVVALATGAVVAMPANHQKRQWSGINRWWSRPSPDAVVTVTGYAPEPTNWDDDSSSSTSTTISTTTTVVVAVSATPTYGGNFYVPSSEAPAPTTTEAPSAPAQTWAAAPTATATSAPSSGGASGGVGDYMSIVSKWRAAGAVCLPSRRTACLRVTP